MMRIDTQHVALLCQDAKLIVHSQSHFVALRRLDGEWEVNLGNKTHTWQKAVMAKQPSTGQPFLSETSKGCCVLNPRLVCLGLSGVIQAHPLHRMFWVAAERRQGRRKIWKRSASLRFWMSGGWCGTPACGNGCLWCLSRS